MQSIGSGGRKTLETEEGVNQWFFQRLIIDLVFGDARIQNSGLLPESISSIALRALLYLEDAKLNVFQKWFVDKRWN